MLSLRRSHLMFIIGTIAIVLFALFVLAVTPLAGVA